MRQLIASVAVAAFFVAGCAEVRTAKDKAGPARSLEADGARAARKEAAGGGQEKQAREDRPADQPETKRKVIYTGSVSLVVEDMDEAESKLTAYLDEHKAQVVRSDVRATSGHSRQGTWTIRVPAARGDGLRKELLKLGELQNSALDSDDVTDAYYDSKAILENLEKEEVATRKVFERVESNPNSKAAEIHETRRELARIRGEIHVHKGRLQRWDKNVEFTTYTLTMYERKGYVPPASPDFGTSLGRTWSGSVESLLSLGKAIVTAVVAVVPWLPVLAVVALPLWLLFRKLRRALASAADYEAVEEPRRRQRPVMAAVEVAPEEDPDAPVAAPTSKS